MKVALIGGTGFVGREVLAELLARGHQVTALARNPGHYTAHPGLRVVNGDATDAHQVESAVRGHDAVISAFNPGWGQADIHRQYTQGYEAILRGAALAGVTRLLAVGGAGSLEVAPGVQLVDTPDFPAEWLEGARAARDLLTRLRQDTVLHWTLVSPPIGLEPGPRTGRYRLGADQLLPGDGREPAGISVADLAVAIVDELERGQFIGQRFSVASSPH